VPLEPRRATQEAQNYPRHILEKHSQQKAFLTLMETYTSTEKSLDGSAPIVWLLVPEGM
jgi:hypothetical protein